MSNKFSFVITLWWILLLGFLGGMIICFAPKEERMSEEENRNLAGMPEFSFEMVKDASFMTGVEDYLSDGFFERLKLVETSSKIKAIVNIKSEEEMLNVDMEQEVNKFVEEAAPESIDINMPKGENENNGAVETEADNLPQTYETEGEEYTFWLDFTDGSKRIVYTYPQENLDISIEALNAYRNALPADGELHFFQIPYGYLANLLIYDTRNNYAGWGCDAENYMRSKAEPGVYIHNGPEILEPYLMEGEMAYYTTDYHWSALGAYYGFAGIREDMGLPYAKYEDYDYTIYDCYVGHGKSDNPANAAKTDRLEVMHTLFPVEASYQIVNLNEQTDVPYMYYNLKSYLAYLSGTIGPWRRIITGADTGRNCLIITDSFGNAFTPYLFPYYDEVHILDLRPSYYSRSTAGYSVREYIEYYGVDDVYVMLSTSSSMNSGYMLNYLLKYLDY